MKLREILKFQITRRKFENQISGLKLLEADNLRAPSPNDRLNTTQGLMMSSKSSLAYNDHNLLSFWAFAEIEIDGLNQEPNLGRPASSPRCPEQIGKNDFENAINFG